MTRTTAGQRGTTSIADVVVVKVASTAVRGVRGVHALGAVDVLVSDVHVPSDDGATAR